MNDLTNEIDPRGLIRDSYLIEEISVEECRSIFLDWALFDEHELPQVKRIKHLLDHYGEADPSHPMTGILRAGLDIAKGPVRRRGGRKGRVN